MKVSEKKHHSADINKQTSAYQHSINGVTVSSEELYRLHKDALRVIHHPDAMVSNVFPGAYKALFHGRGLEFKEVRQYQSGDDFRLIDWRVTARTGQMHTKLFQQEKEQTLFLIVDGSPSMHFGSRQYFKWVLAAHIAAIFTWLAHDNADRVSALVYGDSNTLRFVTPGIGESSNLRLFHLLSETEPQIQHKKQQADNNSKLYDAIRYLNPLVRSDSMVLILSDFRDLDDVTRRQLKTFARRTDVAAIHLYDRLEKMLPEKGTFPVTNGLKTLFFDAGQKDLKQQYHSLFESQLEDLQRFFRKQGSILYSIGTHQDLVDSLRYITGSRLRIKKGTGYA